MRADVPDGCLDPRRPQARPQELRHLRQAEHWRDEHKPKARQGRTARARQGAQRRDPQPLRRPLQALRAPRLRVAFRLRPIPELGPHQLGQITKAGLQRLVGEWQAAGLNASTIRNTINAVCALYRDADVLLNDGDTPTRASRNSPMPDDDARIADALDRIAEDLAAVRALLEAAPSPSSRAASC